MVGAELQVAIVIINHNDKICWSLNVGKKVHKGLGRGKIVRPSANTWLACQQHKGSPWRRLALAAGRRWGCSLHSPALTWTTTKQGHVTTTVLDLQKRRLSEVKQLSQGCKIIKWRVWGFYPKFSPRIRIL